MRKKIVLVSALVGAAVCALAAPAAAHVTVDPPSAPQGSTVKLSFLAPNEEPPATMTELAVQFPTPPETPIPTVTVEQKPGWKITVTMLTLAKPIVTDDGSIDKVVQNIEWKATAASARIGPGDFGEFTIDADGLPTNENQVVFRAIQTYSTGKSVSWIDPVTPGGPPADYPTPILQLTSPNGSATPTTAPASSGTTATVTTSTNDNSARALAIIGIALGAVALLAATGALMKRRRA